MSCTTKVVMPREKIAEEDDWIKNIVVKLQHVVGCTMCSQKFKLDDEEIAKQARVHFLQCTARERASVWHVCLTCGKREADRVELVKLEKKLGFV